MRSTGTVLVLVLLSLTAEEAFALTPQFLHLPGYGGGAIGISGDGSVLVGDWYDTTGGGGWAACFWTLDGTKTNLGPPFSVAYAASQDGSVIVGEGWSASGYYAGFRWTSSTGMVSLPFKATGVSGDGSIVVGTWGVPGSEFTKGKRWTDAEGSVTIPNAARAEAITPDGTVIAGCVKIGSSSPSYPQAGRWTQSTGMVAMGVLPGGTYGSYFTALSADGSVLVGGSSVGGNWEAVRWTQEIGLVSLGHLPGVNMPYDGACDVSADGSIVVGYAHDSSGYQAFIWDTTHGMRKLADFLVDDCGLDLGGWHLEYANAISDDGTVIVGRASEGAFVAIIPEPATLSLLAAGLGAIWIKRRRSR